MTDPAPMTPVPSAFARALVVSGLLVYVAGFASFPPEVVSVSDEVAYLRQATAFAQGRITILETDPVTGEERRQVPSPYPVGTSALQAPLVWTGGWRAASIVSVSCLVAAVVLTAGWLSAAGRSPLPALLVLGYAPALVLGRVAMSDVPSAAVVALSLGLVWRGGGLRAGAGFGAGLAGGLSLLLRETNVVVPGTFVAGALLRRERNAGWMLAGFGVGIAASLAASALVFGSPFHLRDPGHGLALAAVPRNAPLYLFALLVMVPGGLAAGLLYRGPRRAETVAAVAGFVLVFLAYDYGGELTGGLKHLVVGPRYFIPLTPLLAWTVADAARRVGPRLLARPGLRRAVAAGTWAWASAVLVGAALVHPVHDAWGRRQREVVAALFDHTAERGAVVTNTIATGRFLSEVYGPRRLVPHHRIAPTDVPGLLQRYRQVQLAFLERTDHAVPGRWFHETAPFVEGVKARCHIRLVYHQAHPGIGAVSIWDVAECGPDHGAPGPVPAPAGG